MSYMDNGEDEVDYGEEEIEDRSAGPPSFHSAGEVSAFAQDQAIAEEEDYEDLYDDVNIDHFEPPPEISPKKKGDDGGAALTAGSFDEDDGFLDGTSQAAAPNYGSTHKAPFAFVKQEALPSEQVMESQGNPTKLSILPSIKQEAVEHAEIKPLGHTQYQQGMESKGHAGASTIALSSSQIRPKDEKDQGLAWRLASPKQVKDEGDNSAKASNQKGLTGTTFMSQGRGSGTLSTEPSAGVGHIGKDTDSLGASDSGAVNLANIANRGRPPGRLVDGEKGSTGPARLVNRESSAIVPNDYTSRHGGSSQTGDGGSSNAGGTMLFVGDLEWWTTDAELEAALSEFGTVKTLKFFEERASGKSKGYCQVEFFDYSAAAACKERMNGRKFHGRSCLVAFANPRTVIHLGNVQVSKAQAQIQAQQAQLQSRRTMNDTGGSTRGTTSYQGGDSSRSYGRMMGGRSGSSHGQSAAGRGSGRGRTNIGSKGMSGNGGTGAAGAAYGQAIVGPMGSHPSGLIMPQAMLGQGYDAGYGPPRGATGYGGYVLPGPPFTGMMPPFPAMGPGTITGVAPHVNPAFFSRNATVGGLGMMAGNGMDGGLWGDAGLNGWGTEEPDRRAREVGYGDDIGGSDYGYNSELNYEKGRGGSRDKDWERANDGDWPEKWRRDDREVEKEQRYKDRDGYRDQRDRERDVDDDWEREKPSRARSKIRMVDEEEKEDSRPRLREEDYGKRRRMGSER